MLRLELRLSRQARWAFSHEFEKVGLLPFANDWCNRRHELPIGNFDACEVLLLFVALSHALQRLTHAHRE
jgi:hypothetical protein